MTKHLKLSTCQMSSHPQPLSRESEREREQWRERNRHGHREIPDKKEIMGDTNTYLDTERGGKSWECERGR